MCYKYAYLWICLWLLMFMVGLRLLLGAINYVDFRVVCGLVSLGEPQICHFKDWFMAFIVCGGTGIHVQSYKLYGFHDGLWLGFTR